MNDVRRCLMEIDIPGIRAAWAKARPHLPQPRDDHEALICIHRARTQATSIPFRLRAYSHRWLVERGLPSGLPDRQRPRAEQVVPKIVDGVGVAVIAGSSLTKPIVGMVRDAMSGAVMECYADGHREPEIVRPRMLEARATTVRQILGLKV